MNFVRGWKFVLNRRNSAALIGPEFAASEAENYVFEAEIAFQGEELLSIEAELIKPEVDFLVMRK